MAPQPPVLRTTNHSPQPRPLSSPTCSRHTDQSLETISDSFINFAGSVCRPHRSVEFAARDDIVLYAADGSKKQFRTFVKSVARKQFEAQGRTRSPLARIRKAVGSWVGGPSAREKSGVKVDGRDEGSRRMKMPNTMTDVSKPCGGARFDDEEAEQIYHDMAMHFDFAPIPTDAPDRSRTINRPRPKCQKPDASSSPTRVATKSRIIDRPRPEYPRRKAASKHIEQENEAPLATQFHAPGGSYLPHISRKPARIPNDGMQCGYSEPRTRRGPVEPQSLQPQQPLNLVANSNSAQMEERKLKSHLLKGCGHIVRTTERTPCAANCACLPEDWDHTPYAQSLHRVPHRQLNHPCPTCVDGYLDRKYAQLEADFRATALTRQVSFPDPWSAGSASQNCSYPTNNFSNDGCGWDATRDTRTTLCTFRTSRKSAEVHSSQLRNVRYAWQAQKNTDRTSLLTSQIHGNANHSCDDDAKERTSWVYLGESSGALTELEHMGGAKRPAKRRSDYRGVERSVDLRWTGGRRGAL